MMADKDNDNDGWQQPQWTAMMNGDNRGQQ